MKAKVLTKFYDTAAKVVREKDDIIDVTPARFNEITRKGRYIEAYDEAAEKAASEKK
jgi:hypothetical protein